MNRERAETLALQAVSFLAGDEDRLDRFLLLSGMDGNDLRERIADAAFLGGVLDHILAHEPDLIEFAEAVDLPPEQVARARAALPGLNPDW